jgi:hypothetical protein
MQFRDETNWKKFAEDNQDPYGSACVRYAKAWAEQMEMLMKDGATVEQCAKKASHDANTEGITGFMYGCAVSILAQCWIHGEALRRLHNRDTQIGTEGDKANETGGVLNPALLIVG